MILPDPSDRLTNARDRTVAANDDEFLGVAIAKARDDVGKRNTLAELLLDAAGAGAQPSDVVIGNGCDHAASNERGGSEWARSGCACRVNQFTSLTRKIE